MAQRPVLCWPAQAYGAALLLLVAARLACFGLYYLFDARYRRG